MDSEALYRQLGSLVSSVPDFSDDSQETQLWLGRCYALVKAVGNPNDDAQMQKALPGLRERMSRPTAAQLILGCLYRAFAVAEMAAPASVQGAFIPIGANFDSFAAIGKILTTAANDILIVDPYMDETILTDFLVLAPTRTRLRLLSDQGAVRPSLEPAARRWLQQFGTTNPLEVRLSASRSLHDRLILIDSSTAYIVSQSFKDLANRSPASIVKCDAEVSALKAPAYESIWAISSALI